MQQNSTFAAYRGNCSKASIFFVQKSKRTKNALGPLSIRKFPVDLRDLINRTVNRLNVERDEFVTKLLRRDLKQVAITFAEVDRHLEEIQRWWTSIERDVE